MTEAIAARVRAAGLVAPRYDGAHLGLVLPGLAAALGVDLGGAGSRARRELGLTRSERVVVVLVDGLGRRNLAERAGHAPFLRSLLADDDTGLVTGFPTTTTTSLGLFGTGRPGGRTGLVGYSIRNPETGGLGNFVRWEGVPDPAGWQREESVLGRIAAAGVPVTSIGPARFAGSGLTQAALAGGRYEPVEGLELRADAALRALREPGLVYLYWGEVDKVGHAAGWQSGAWGAALESADAELARLARGLPAGTSMLVTADHGMVDVDPTARVDLGELPSLAADVEMLGGEPRAPHVYLRPGVAADAAARRWTDALGDAGVVLTRDEVIAAGWLGDVVEHVAPAIGDLVIAMTGRATVVDSVQGPAGLGRMVGVHGSLTPHEVEIPLLRTGA